MGKRTKHSVALSPLNVLECVFRGVRVGDLNLSSAIGRAVAGRLLTGHGPGKDPLRALRRYIPPQAIRTQREAAAEVSSEADTPPMGPTSSGGHSGVLGPQRKTDGGPHHQHQPQARALATWRIPGGPLGDWESSAEMCLVFLLFLTELLKPVGTPVMGVTEGFGYVVGVTPGPYVRVRTGYRGACDLQGEDRGWRLNKPGGQGFHRP